MIPSQKRQLILQAAAAVAAAVYGTDARAGHRCDKSPEALSAWWKLDTGEADIADAAGRSPGTALGPIAPAEGLVDGGLYLDGESGQVEVRDSESLDLGTCPLDQGGPAAGPCDFTIEAWIYTRNEIGFHPLVDKRRQDRSG